VGCRTLVLAVACSGFLGTQIGPGVSAAFTSHTGATTGTLSFAQLSASFATGTDDLGGAGGVGGSTYTMSVSVTLLTSAHRYTTLTNTGSVTEALNGTLTATGLSGTLNVAVDACSVAWALGLCTGTTTSLLGTTSVGGTPGVSYGSVAVSALRYLRYTFTTPGVSASATVTATAVPTGTGTGDRTAG
jgi:hypothetical protein